MNYNPYKMSYEDFLRIHIAEIMTEKQKYPDKTLAEVAHYCYHSYTECILEQQEKKDDL